MGVPKLFRWLANKYPEILQRANVNESSVGTSNSNLKSTSFNSNLIQILFFDLNSLIHPVCQGLTNENTMFEKIKEYILYIVNIVKPSHSVYCVMDGVAPYAKILQQRQRRYKSIDMKRKKFEFNKKYNLNYQKDWDSNAISPGTLFMKKLAEFLKKELISSKPELKWIINDTYQVGEGEHKIMEIILNETNIVSKHKTLNVCIYGMDADLILLSWCLYLRKNTNISLIREKNNIRKSNHLETEFIYLNIPILIKSFLKEYLIGFVSQFDKDDLLIQIDNTSIDNYKQICYDFIYLTIFLGNDFLPPLFGINISSNGIEYLLNIYRICCNRNKLFYLIDYNSGNIKIQYHYLLEYLIELEKIYQSKILPEFYLEYIHYEPKIRNNYQLNLQLKGHTENEKIQIQKEYNELETIYEKDDPLDLCNLQSMDLFTKYYYDRYFESDMNVDSNFHQNMIENYLTGFSWIMEYYTKFYFTKKQTISFGYHYYHLQCPLLSSIIFHLKKIVTKNEINFTTKYLNEPYVPYYPFSVYQSLSLILPKESYYLIPKGFIENLNKEILEKEIYNKELEKVVYVKDYKIHYSECNIILDKIEYKKLFCI